MTDRDATGPATGSTRLLLVGAGHTHLHLITRAAELRAAGYRVRVLAPVSFHYSGTASATVGGALSAADGTVDVRRLAAAHGVEHHDARLVGLDRVAKVVTTSTGARLDYDVVSFNVGSVVDDHAVVSSTGPTTRPATAEDHAGPSVVRVKPLADLARLDALLEASRPAVVTVVGAGTTGVEVAAQLSTRPDVARVRLLGTAAELAPALPAGARRAVRRVLDRRVVDVRLGARVVAVSDHRVELDDGTGLTHDVAILATGLTAPALVTRLALGTAQGIPVRATLQHVDDDDVHAVGDCAHFTARPLPHIGVHGVRQAPVLLQSLLDRAAGAPLPTYSPQRSALAVLDLGDGTGLAVRGRWWWQGPSALRLKRHLDRRWLRRYQIDQ